MIALDTNILARAIVVEQDADEATLLQQQRAKALLASGDTLFVPITVIQELEWVLRGAYDLPQAEIADVLEDMLAIENFVVDRAAAVGQAVAWYRRGLDFSDALHLAQAGLCSRLASFDDRFVKRAGREGLQPAVTLA
jgi:predicted nucleic-acid-binding protein